jgi:hypothetical protein
MQGIASIQDMPFSRQDYQSMAKAIGAYYDSMSPEQKQALSGVAQEIGSLPIEKLNVFDQLLNFLEKNVGRYKEVVAELVRRDAVDEGDLPDTYDPAVFSLIHSLVRESLKKASNNTQRFAKGGLASLKHSAARIKAAGRGDDTVLAHITPAEAALLKARGGSGDTNPLTGLPEYGFFKSIGKIFKAAAPIIGTVVGGMVGMPFLGAVIGGGIGGAMGGGGIKGALMGAGMSALGSLAFGGASSLFNGGTFMEGVTGTLPSYLGGTGESFGGTLFGSGANAGGTGTAGAGRGSVIEPAGARADAIAATGTGANAAPAGGAAPTAPVTAAKTSFFDDPMKFISQNKGPLLLAGGAGLLAANSMGEKKAPASLVDNNKELTKEEREAKYPWTVIDQSKFTNNYVAPTNQAPQYEWQKGVYETPKFVAAKGGIADIRSGGHLEGPGTGTSDSIPAKLSDGEFVMTAKAVRGAGGGDRMKGAKKMYELMHKFERVA